MHGSGQACTTTFQVSPGWSLVAMSRSTTSGTRFNRSPDEIYGRLSKLKPSCGYFSFRGFIMAEEVRDSLNSMRSPPWKNGLRRDRH